MAQMATTPVFACRGCGRPVVFTHLSTTVNDPNAELLKSFMQHLSEIALCKDCRRRKDWKDAHGRSDEFHINPEGIIYAVIDKSGLDYYGRKMK